MNERVMQFRIGMFVIVAGLVLTMMIVWFGESPSLLRDQMFVKVHYTEAPGVLEGVAVRKSGIRIGEVVGIEFDGRPNQPDGVIVTLAIERKYPVREGSVPRLSRSLIGDVTIDLLPGDGDHNLELGRSAAEAPIIEGEVAADPSKALAAATKAFEKAGDTLNSINEAASGLSRISRNADQLDALLKTWTTTGTDLSEASRGLSGFIRANEGEFKSTLEDLQHVARKLDGTLSPETQDAFKSGVARFSSAAARLDGELADAAPLMKDLGAPPNHTPTTDFGQSLRRINRIASDLELLSATLRTRQGTLNTSGSLQKMLTQTELHDNFNALVLNANQAVIQLKAVLGSFRSFAERVSRDPAALSRGMLQR